MTFKQRMDKLAEEKEIDDDMMWQLK